MGKDKAVSEESKASIEKVGAFLTVLEKYAVNFPMTSPFTVEGVVFTRADLIEVHRLAREYLNERIGRKEVDRVRRVRSNVPVSRRKK